MTALVASFPSSISKPDEWIAFSRAADTDTLTSAARAMRDAAFGKRLTYSRKVFLPLTQLCRDVCHYCTFAKAPRHLRTPYMTLDEVLAVAKQGEVLGCKEALFTLGERPEARYRAAADWLAHHGYRSTVHYVAAAAEAVVKHTGLLPHINCGTMTADEIALLRPISASMGLMLESASERLMQPGMPHHGSIDKYPAVRLETLARLGEARVPTTSGILIGIGETEAERVEALLALRELHDRYGHIQEIIVQNFRAKPGTRMAQHAEPVPDDFVRAVSLARLIFGSSASIQVPPNLNANEIAPIVDAGIDDWGGISPLTIDFVNPEAPWPNVDALSRQMQTMGRELIERTTIYPRYASDAKRWLDPSMTAPTLRVSDAEALGRDDQWRAGSMTSLPQHILDALGQDESSVPSALIGRVIDKARSGGVLSVDEIESLFKVRGRDFAAVCSAANDLRREVNGDVVSYVVTRNINYTNVCTYSCGFCAFSKGKTHEDLRGKPYEVTHGEIARRVREAWSRGATEVCMQGGIHPSYTGDTYLDILRTAKAACPDMHIHAFSPLEIAQGARTLGLSLKDYLSALKSEGLGSLPGTAAEILDDDVRAILCADKLLTGQWCEVIETAHEAGLRTTATIMYGHVERPIHWARHLARIRALQDQTGGFTEFVPLPFVASEAPIYLKGNARPGPTFREAILMHAVARLALHTAIPNIQTSWVKMGPQGVQAALRAGVNDLGGTLMNESITRAAGSVHGQEADPQQMREWIVQAGRTPRQRTTLYDDANADRIMAAACAVALEPVANAPFARRKTGARLATPV